MKNYNYNYYFITYADSGDSTSEVFKNMSNISHVNDVFIDDYQMYSVFLDSINNISIKGNFYLVGATNEMLSKKYGVNVELKDNEIVCPKLFYPSDNIEGHRFTTSSKLIDMENLKNKNINIHYYKYIDDYNSKQKNLTLKLTDIYENNHNIIDENICYSNRNLIKNIFDDSYENVDLSNQIGSIIISIDDQGYYSEVKEIVEEYGYQITGTFTLNSKFLSFIKVSTYALVIFSLLFVIVFTSNLNKKRLLDRTKEFGIIRSIGGDNKTIFKVLMTEITIILIMCIVYSTMSVIIILSILKIIVNIYPFIFDKIPVVIDYSSLILFIIMITLILVIENMFYARKICNNDIMVNINE